MFDEDQADQVFHALAHRMRRQILDYVQTNPGCPAGEIAAQFEVSRIAVTKHLKLLEQADLLVVEQEGRSRLHYLNIMPIQAIYSRWSDQYSQFFASRMHDFASLLENDITLPSSEDDDPEEPHEQIA